MKIKNNKYDDIVNITCLLCLIVCSLILYIIWDKIPSQIPGHYNAAGEIDKISDKSSLILTLFFGWLLFTALSVLEKFPQIWNTGVEITEQNKDKVYRILKNMIVATKLLTSIVFCLLTLAPITGKNLPAFFLPLYIFLMFGLLAAFIFQLFKAK